MRSRMIFVLAALFLTLVVPRPAHAGGWTAFIAWLSKLDPGPSKGIGLEFTPQCLRKGSFDVMTCTYPSGKPAFLKPVIRAEGQLLVGNVDNEVGHAMVFLAMGTADYLRVSRVFIGSGGGALVVSGIPGGHQTVLALRPVRVTVVASTRARIGFKAEWNWLPQGFPEGAFAAGAPKTGQESVVGVSFFWVF
jgi:hypothetical protein